MSNLAIAADIELAEMIRFYGSIVGTEGVSKEIQKQCNDNIKTILDALQPRLTKLLAEKSGLIV